MGKYEKKKTDFDDIQKVFCKRDQNRSVPQDPRDYPEVPAFMNEPRRIRGNPGYSMDNLRDVHEGRAVYDGSPAYVESSAVRGRNAVPQQPVCEQPPCCGDQPVYDQPRGTKARRRKKHRLLRFLGKTVLFLLALLILAGALSLVLAKMPETDQPIGARKDGCCTVLLCGTDEEGTRTDTMVLLYLDRNGKQIRLLSLPRDTMVNRDSPVPKLNGAYGANGGATGNRKQGMKVLMDYVKDLVGFRPDGYMLIDLNCFEELVDVMGGVTYDVPMDMYYNDPTQELYIDLKAGTQKLNGQEAMWLVRYRSGYAMADLERVRVQRDFLSAAVSQWKSLSHLPRVPFAAALLMKNTQTDLSYRNLCWIALALARGGSMDSDTLPGEPAWVNGGAYYVEDRAKAAELINESYNPYETPISADELHPYGY